MKAFVEPIPTTLSRAMHRVANALTRYAPPSVQIVYSPDDADLQFVHTIGYDSIDVLQAPRYVVIQYCHGGKPSPEWSHIWRQADAVWSYYDLSDYMPSGVPFIHRPLGIDQAFLPQPNGTVRSTGVMTSGFVHGTGAEAIEEPAQAAEACGLSTLHLGPRPVGMAYFPPHWKAMRDVSDGTLAAHYRRTRWVSGLRHVEGFEFPVIEGLACGCRPFVFDRPETRRWFEGHVEFVPECEGQDLVDALIPLFKVPPRPVTLEERQTVLKTFAWNTIARHVWAAVGAE